MYKNVITEVRSKKHYNYNLDGCNALYKVVVEETWEVERIKNREKVLSQKLLESKKEVIKTFPLHAIEPFELTQIYKSGTPGFVLKVEGEHFFTEVPKGFQLRKPEFFKNHLCIFGNLCNRYHSWSDDEGGCAKIRGGSIGIWTYPFIKEGYEIFNTVKSDGLVVSQCTRFEEAPPRKNKKTNTADLMMLYFGENTPNAAMKRLYENLDKLNE